MVRHPPKIARPGLGRATVETAVDLHRVDADDLPAEALAGANGELALADRGRTDHHQKRRALAAGLFRRGGAAGPRQGSGPPVALLVAVLVDGLLQMVLAVDATPHHPPAAARAGAPDENGHPAAGHRQHEPE